MFKPNDIVNIIVIMSFSHFHLFYRMLLPMSRTFVEIEKKKEKKGVNR